MPWRTIAVQKNRLQRFPLQVRRKQLMLELKLSQKGSGQSPPTGGSPSGQPCQCCRLPGRYRVGDCLPWPHVSSTWRVPWSSGPEQDKGAEDCGAEWPCAVHWLPAAWTPWLPWGQEATGHKSGMICHPSKHLPFLRKLDRCACITERRGEGEDRKGRCFDKINSKCTLA